MKEFGLVVENVDFGPLVIEIWNVFKRPMAFLANTKHAMEQIFATEKEMQRTSHVKNVGIFYEKHATAKKLYRENYRKISQGGAVGVRQY